MIDSARSRVSARGWTSVLAGVAGRFERTEQRLVAVTAVLAAALVLLGFLGQSAVRDREALLDDAVHRGNTLTGAALDVYRALADADATSLNAVVVEPHRVSAERKRFREDLFDAADALRVAASLTPAGPSADRVRDLTDRLPEYSRLVESGWRHSAVSQPVGTSYLAQASHLVRGDLLRLAGELHREQAAALTEAQSAAGRPPWEVFAVGAATLVLFVLAQRYLARRTRRRFNRGLVLSTALVLASLVTVGISVTVAAGHADASVREFDTVVAPLAKARNLAREADGDEVRILVFPKVGDVASLRDGLAALDEQVSAAGSGGGDRQRIDRAATALLSWRAAVRPLIEPGGAPLTYQQMSGLVIGTDQAAHAQQFDEVLTDAITWHSTHAATSTATARGALTNIDEVFVVCATLALLSLGWGLWPRIREYY
ncbi:hypothetical protein Aglo03_42680 [Actinokineospora globicatena]|uniref:Four helix bundle sensory module for signal transduction n=1 Tax=Actinokineospora globicatena TaxID=103729 RepID=A0A9W6V9M1_9PSEU|nr:hypothetical protein Aglo03_42680 [Actinokineospora globicatena]